jgi:hypothetical protein
MWTDPKEEAALLRRTISVFAEAIAVTPPDALSDRQPRRGRGRPPAAYTPLTKRDVYIEAMTAAADLLHALSAIPIHACPTNGETCTPCCHRDVLELPFMDRMTLDQEQVTCGR